MSVIGRIYSVIKSPLVTEKTDRFSQDRKYSFWVDLKANKVEIKRAVEKIYNVKVGKVASMIVEGKTKKVRWNQPGKTAVKKKAIVTLRKGYEIKAT